MSPYNPVEVSFPNQIEVRVNNDDVKSNYKGLKNKPGSTKPADLTDKVRKQPGYSNQINVTYALTTKKYAFVVFLVKYSNPDILTQRIRALYAHAVARRYRFFSYGDAMILSRYP